MLHPIWLSDAFGCCVAHKQDNFDSPLARKLRKKLCLLHYGMDIN